MIGQGLKAVCPCCETLRPCIMRERKGKDGFKEYYLQCYICKHTFTNAELEQENEWYRKEQELAARDSVFLVVKGEPVPQGRPRFASVKGRFVHAYDPKDSVVYKNLIKWHIRQFQNQYPQVPVLQENIIFSLKIFRSMPASFSKKKRQMVKDGLLFPNMKPDTDNYVKTVLDACNGMLFRDDSAVIGIFARKYYSDAPRIEATFLEMKDKTVDWSVL